MGNVGSGGGNGRRRQGSRRNQPPPQHVPHHPEIAANRYVFPGAAPYPGQYPNPNPNPNLPPGYYQQYSPAGYYPSHPLPMPLPAPYDHHHRVPQLDPAHANWSAAAGRNPYGQGQAPFVEHQKAITIRNDVNLKKESLRVEKDEENPGKYLVAFSFDAIAAGSITIIFFANEGEDFQLKALKESILPPITIEFEPGLAQKFRQPSGTGIDFSMFEGSELLKQGETDAYPLAVKAETHPPQETDSNGNTVEGSINSQITQAVFEKEKGEYHVKVVKQFLWVNGTRYELQEIYGIGNSVEGETDANDPGKECVICLSEPRDTTVLPCRHMCMCSGCAKVLRYQTNRCPICRQPVERLLEIKVGNDTVDTDAKVEE